VTDFDVSRRRLLAVLAASGALGLAGCSDRDGDGGDGSDDAEDRDPTTAPNEATETTGSGDRTTVGGSTSASVPDPRLFTGEARAFVVNGYSTSFVWPGMLQRKLDRHFDGDRVIEVVEATEPGTPIARWMDPDTGEPKEPWRETLAPALDRDVPVVALAQQSLQWAFGERHEGIRGVDDEERIERGADVLERYADRLLEDGAEHVFVATHIYKEPMEPIIGNERLALARLLERDPPAVSAGPDLWDPTRDHWPEAFQDDEVHPNDVGAEIMAHGWFARLLRSDGRDVPDWSREEMEAAIENGGSD